MPPAVRFSALTLSLAMCCFSRPVRSVTETTIFARLDGQGRQFIAYAMRLDAPEDLSMILPIPVPAASDEKAVEFISLEAYSNFFSHLSAGFPRPQSFRSKPAAARGLAEGAPLQVHRVGSFDASFVPKIADFRRLDRRFRLPEGTWEKLPQYGDWGFVVFKLRKGDGQIHPMAFAFPSRHAGQLFFPTVHIHDGLVHAMADFDHVLYGQATRAGSGLRAWDESPKLARHFVNVPYSKGLVLPDLHVLRHKMRGQLKNEDVLVPVAAA